MKVTSERSRPDDISIRPIFCQHQAAYKYAAKFAKDREVLDIGCGEGYGTDLLAKQAKKVTGIDYSKDTIEQAKRNYRSSNIEFICTDINYLKLPEKSFEIVCGFQVIEHLWNPEALLSKIRRLLKSDGLFLLSTPNKKASIIKHPYYFREYDQEELLDILSKYFPRVNLFGLQFSQKVALFRERRKQESRKVLRLDPLRLHCILPRFIWQRLFDVTAARLSKKNILRK